MTNRPETFDSPLIRSSVTPSLKHSCAGSWPRFANGRTATDGLSGSGGPTDSGVPSQRQPAQPPMPSSVTIAVSAATPVAARLASVDDARELGEHVVAGGVHHPPAARGHRRCDALSVLGDGAHRRGLVLAHETAAFLDVGAQDGREPALDGSPVHGPQSLPGRRRMVVSGSRRRNRRVNRGGVSIRRAADRP